MSKDIRLIAAILALVGSIIGYITLVLTGHTHEGENLLTLVGLPSLTWILGLGSSLAKVRQD